MAAKKKAAPKVPAKKPTAKKAPKKSKTSSAPGEAAKAHEWLMSEANDGAAKLGPPDLTHAKLAITAEDIAGPVEVTVTKTAPARASQLDPYKWKPGQSGNPKGRVKGSRSKFAEAFISDFLADWESHGAEAIVTCRETRLDVYMATARAILPKQMDVRVSEFEQLTEDALDERLRELGADLAALTIATASKSAMQ